MSGKAKGQVKATVIKAADPVISAPVKKSDAPSQVTVEEAVNAGDWIEPPMMLEGLKKYGDRKLYITTVHKSL